MGGVTSRNSRRAGGNIEVGQVIETPKYVSGIPDYLDLTKSYLLDATGYPELAALVGLVGLEFGPVVATDLVFEKMLGLTTPNNITSVYHDVDTGSILYGTAFGGLYTAPDVFTDWTEVLAPTQAYNAAFTALTKFNGVYYANLAANTNSFGIETVYQAPAISGPWTAAFVHPTSGYTFNYVNGNALLGAFSPWHPKVGFSAAPSSGWTSYVLSPLPNHGIEVNGLWTLVCNNGVVLTSTTPLDQTSWVQSTLVPNSTDHLYHILYDPVTGIYSAHSSSAYWTATDPQGVWTRFALNGGAFGSLTTRILPAVEGFFAMQTGSSIRFYQRDLPFAPGLQVPGDTDGNVISGVRTGMVMPDKSLVLVGNGGAVYIHDPFVFNPNTQLSILAAPHSNTSYKYQMRAR